MVQESERRARQGGPTWVYYVNWPSPLDGGKWKAPHMIDIPLVFANPEQSNYTAGSMNAQQLAELVSEALINFARDGDPNTQHLPKWPKFNLERRPAMIFDLPTRLENDPRGGGAAAVRSRRLCSTRDLAAVEPEPA
jgi:para-nitrobenzyl esterase